MRRAVLALLGALGGCVHPEAVPASRAAPRTETLAVATSRAPGDRFSLRDAFDGALGLNDALAARQQGDEAPVSWTRLPGLWFPAQAPGEQASTVRDGRLYLLANGAVRLDRAIPAAGRHHTLRARVDPVAGDAQSLGWCSVILQDRPDADGWVHGRASYVALLLRSHGGVELTSRGQGRALEWLGPETARGDGRSVALGLSLEEGPRGNVVRLEGTVDGRAFRSVIDEGPGVVIPPVWAVFGAHFHPGDEPVSWVDDVAIGGDPALGG